MTKLATALLLFAGGLVAASSTTDSPTVATPSAAKPVGKHRGSLVSRGVRRVPLPSKSASPLAHKPKPRPPVTPAPARTAAGHLNWSALAQCESSGNPQAVSMGRYFGLYQFDLQTWASVGGTGNPADASPDEQTLRASLLYADRGASPWPVCGYHLEDAA